MVRGSTLFADKGKASDNVLDSSADLNRRPFY